MVYKGIRDLRKDNDLRQKDLALNLCCSQQVYSNYELGQRDVPGDILIKLSKFHNVSLLIIFLESATTQKYKKSTQTGAFFYNKPNAHSTAKATITTKSEIIKP